MLVLSLIFLNSCKDNIEYSIIPEIELSDDQVFVNPTEMKIRFTDGDGDIGLSEEDANTPPYEFVPDSVNEDISSNIFYYNLVLYYFESIDGAWEEADLLIPYYYRVPDLTPSGRNKTLKGEIVVDIVLEVDRADSVRFEIELFDRELHISNRLVTPSIFK